MAQWKDVVYLITPQPVKTNGVYTTDLATSPQRKAIGNHQGITMKEFYAAEALDLRPEFKVTLRRRDYQNEMYLKWSGSYFKLSRVTNSENEEYVTFTCLRLVSSIVSS